MFYRLLVTEIFKNNARLLSKTYRDRVKELIKQHLESARVRREKMKPAKTEFYQRKLFYGNLEIFAFWDIRFVNQDNRAEDEQKIENRLKALAWKNDLKNICAVVVLITLICILTYANIHVWYHDKLWTIALRDSRFDSLINFSLYANFVEPNFFVFPELARSNYWLVEVLTSACSTQNMLF